MDVRITNAELLNLYGALTQINLTGSAKFTYILSKNRAVLKPHAEALQQAAQSYGKDNPRVAEYQKQIDALLKKFAVDEKGKPVTRNAGQDGSMLQYIIPPAKHAEYLAARELLDADYKDIILGMDLHNASMAAVLREEVEVKDLRPLPLSEIPNEGMNTQIMNLIFILVEDEKPEKGKLVELPKKERPDGPALA